MPTQPDRTSLCGCVAQALKVVESCSKAQKTWQVSQSVLEKNFLVRGCRFFVSNVISAGLLRHLAHFTWPWAQTIRWQYFSEVCYWKLGYNLSLLILWMTGWGFAFKSYDLNQGSQTRGPHVAREDHLCGPRRFLESFI